MEKLSIGDHAPDFNLSDHQGEMVQFLKKTQDHNVLLVFNIGFA